jgi:hypothetical protein
MVIVLAIFAHSGVKRKQVDDEQHAGGYYYWFQEPQEDTRAAGEFPLKNQSSCGLTIFIEVTERVEFITEITKRPC